MLRFLFALVLISIGASEASSRTLTIATWNLGWHKDTQTVQRWIAECGKTYTENPGAGTCHFRSVMTASTSATFQEKPSNGNFMDEGAQRQSLIPVGIWALGFVSLLMDISSEMIHALLPIYMVSALGTSVLGRLW